MSICKYCELEMNTADGCVEMPVPTDAGKLPPIPYGGESQHSKEQPAPGQYQHGVLIGDPPRCHDCAALPGHFHHAGCDWEDCPHCHTQLIGCNCLPDAQVETIQ